MDRKLVLKRDRRMGDWSRRRILIVVGGTMGLSGCLDGENDENGEDENENNEEASVKTEDDSREELRTEPTEKEDDESESRRIESIDDFGNRLEEQGIEVTYLQPVSEQIYLDYQTQASEDVELSEEMGIISVTYAIFVASGNDAELLHVIIVDSSGIDLGGFFIMREWAQDFADEEISIGEYSELVHSTLEFE